MESKSDDRSGEDAPPPSSPAEKPARPDWLVGPDQMLTAETEIRKSEASRPPPRKPAPIPPREAPDPDAVPAPEKPSTHGRSPALEFDLPRGGQTASKPTKDISPGHDFVSGLDLEDFRRDIDVTSRPDEAQEPDGGARPNDLEPAWIQDSLARGKPDWSTAPEAEPPAPRPKRAVPTWPVVLKRLSMDRRLHVAAAALALTTYLVMVAADLASITPVARIRRDPVRFDGQVVKLRGKVGETFALGGSYTYYLHDGRDTIVVFTRSQPPALHRRVTVTGSVSTGYLEGVPRAALFEGTP